jgi:hypothetical protein
VPAVRSATAGDSCRPARTRATSVRPAGGGVGRFGLPVMPMSANQRATLPPTGNGVSVPPRTCSTHGQLLVVTNPLPVHGPSTGRAADRVCSSYRYRARNSVTAAHSRRATGRDGPVHGECFRRCRGEHEVDPAARRSRNEVVPHAKAVQAATREPAAFEHRRMRGRSSRPWQDRPDAQTEHTGAGSPAGRRSASRPMRLGREAKAQSAPSRACTCPRACSRATGRDRCASRSLPESVPSDGLGIDPRPAARTVVRTS